MIHDDRDGRDPCMKFVEPVGQCTQRGHDQMGSQVILLLAE